MKKLLVRLVLLPILLIVAVFAVANRQSVDLSLWPLPWDAQAPLFLVLLACLLAGVLIGAGLSWAGGRHHRVAARHHRRDNERLQRQLESLKQHGRAGAAPSLLAHNASPAPPPSNVNASAALIEPRVAQPPPSYTPVNRAR